MSPERSSSAVRNLRSLFENKTTASDTSTTAGRGRSPGGFAADDQQRPRSKIRASFIAVESPNSKPAMNMASAPDFSKIPNSDANDTVDANTALNRQPSTGRRTSFSEDKNSDTVQALKATMAEEGERRKSHAVAEMIPENALETPLVEADKQLGAQKVTKGSPLKKETSISSANQMENGKKEDKKEDKEAANPDKSVTGVEEEPAAMKPAEPTSAEAISGEKKTASKAASAKPATVSTASKPSRPSAASSKSPQSTTSSAKLAASPHQISKKPSRASLSAPTAASVAKSAAAADKVASSKPAAPKPKPREPTKPVEISSRLTAPTAASRARVEGPSASAAKAAPASTRTKPTTSGRPSLGRPDSRSSQTATTKVSAPVDGSFLERMTRPTAAFANRTAKEAESKAAAPKQKLPSRPKTNGQPKKTRPSAVDSADPSDVSVIDQPSVVLEGEHVGEPIEQAQATAAANRPESPANDSVPLAATSNGHHEEALEGTPAGLGTGDSIR